MLWSILFLWKTKIVWVWNYADNMNTLVPTSQRYTDLLLEVRVMVYRSALAGDKIHIRKEH